MGLVAAGLGVALLATLGVRSGKGQAIPPTSLPSLEGLLSLVDQVNACRADDMIFNFVNTRSQNSVM